MTINTDGQLALSGAGANLIGVLQDKPAAQGRAGSVGTAGTTKVIANATLEEGVPVASDANGLAVAAAINDYVLGITREPAVANDIIAVNIDKYQMSA
ncbi:MAG: hypothetical protein ABUK08_00230 [Candidatus Humimicrobiaceae bacterium]